MARRLSAPRTPPQRRVKYAWALGGEPPSVRADVVGRWLIEFERETGELPKRRDLLAAAKPADSALHDLFEWDNRRAAEGFRLHQASMYLCRLRIEVVTPAGRTHTVRAFVSVTPAGRDRGFMAYDQAMADPILREQFVSSALDDLTNFAGKFGTLLEYPTVRASYGMLETAVAALIRRREEKDAA